MDSAKPAAASQSDTGTHRRLPPHALPVLGAGISIIKGDHNGFGPNFSVLGDHFSPIIAILAPFYWIYNGPQTLMFALAVPPLRVHTRRAFGGERSGRTAVAAAYCVSAAYARITSSVSGQGGSK